ncbi:MAG: chloride channel protein [Bacteroidales bacterium]|nr:chloride channel protein [Bacteroidales bacterium]MCB8998480.1 chloride channel protein [Bacteroidales bacterium]MCB9012921.1 chloride channel protein [Bacteroidales bacterium]
MKKSIFYRRVVTFRDKHLGPRRFIIALSFVIGIFGGLVAVLLKNLVAFVEEFLLTAFKADQINFFYFALPLAGIFLTVLFVKFFVKDNISHGVTRILYAMSRNNAILKAHNMYSSMIASTLTVGFGGSVGLEAPIVLTGSAFGSRISKFFHMNYRTTMLMLGCGASAAIAGIFKAPIAALIFALEVLMLDLTMWSLIPLMISAVTGATVAYFLLGKSVIFFFTLQDPFVLNNLPFYIILGIVCGLVSLYFTRGVKYIERRSSKLKNPYEKLVIGGMVLGLLIFLFPPLYGEGYFTLKALLTGHAVDLTNNSFFYQLSDNSWMLLLYLCLVLFFKVIAMSVTTASGGVGGIFAPALFMGGIVGFIVSRTTNLTSFVTVSEKNFTLVGMAGLMAGVMHAPLTAIFLIAEITGGYGLFIPLIVTSAISYMTIIYFEPHSIYTERLARKGDLITHHKDKAVLTLLNLKSVIEKDLKIVKPDATLGDLVKIISKSKRNIFPVVGEEGILEGIILLDDVRSIIFNHELYDTTLVADLMITPPATVSSTEGMESVMKKFEESGAWNLPVTDDRVYVGFISKARIFNMYRKLLVQFSDE